MITRAGSIVDATFVEAPKQRNSREENKQLKENAIPEEWQEKPNNQRRFEHQIITDDKNPNFQR